MLKKIWNAMVAMQEKRAEQITKFYVGYRTMSELSSMTDKELKDVGINRFDIPSIADAKQQPGMRIIPVVNFIDPTDMTSVTFQAEWFTLEACPDEMSI